MEIVAANGYEIYSNMNLKDEYIKRLFPPDTKIIDFVGTPEKYTALLRSKCKTKEEFRRDWLQLYEKLSKVTLRVMLTRPRVGKIVVYKAAFRCEHNTYPNSHQRVKSPHKKHTGCPAVVRVTIKAPTENRRVRTKDTLRGEYPTVIKINHNHNHDLSTKAFSYNESQSNYEQPIKNPPFVGYDVFIETSVENGLNQEISHLEEELDWNSLRDRWNLLFQKWDLTKSVQLYKALLRATTCMESFKTVNGITSALNCFGRKFRTDNYEKNVLQSASLVQPKLYCVQNEDNEINRLEVLNEVDELLVIDHGWIT